MKEVIRIGNERYEKYRDLLLKRDAVQKDAFNYQEEYIREFGELIAECFDAKIACIEKKKIIAYCQKLINRGEKPDAYSLDSYIESVMKEYYEELKEMLEHNRAAKNAKTISDYDVNKVKRTYYRIAKLIHPDINPALATDKTVMDFWNRTVIAYECNNLKEIEELEILINDYLESIEHDFTEVEIEDLEGKIINLNQEIDAIISRDPYQYKYLLMDREAVNSKKEDLKKETEDYRKYAEELDEVIKGFNIERKLS